MSDHSVVQLDVPATFGEVRKIDASLVELLQAAGNIDEGLIYNMELAVHEICSNIVEHAYEGQSGGRIHAVISLSGSTSRELQIELSDAGQAFDPATVTPIDLDLPHEGGYGLFLAQALMDDVHYERRSGRNVWRLNKRL
jgi:serine/threonine-protein kinase RsbW